MKIERFEDIEAWKLAREMMVAVYRATDADGFLSQYDSEHKPARRLREP